MVEIIERDGGTKIKIFKSNRDEIISNQIPKECGLCRESAVYYVVGSPASGKSMLMESIMKKQLKRAFHDVYLCCPRSSRGGYSKSYSTQMNPTKVFEELTLDNLQKVKDGTSVATEENKEAPRFTCLVVDDCASDLRNKHVQKLLLKMIQNHRHMRLTIFIVAQSYQSLHKTLRDTCTCLIQFRTGSIKERKAINEEVLCDYSPNECDEIMHYVFKDKYEFLLYNRRKRLVCKSFNPLEIKIERLI